MQFAIPFSLNNTGNLWGRYYMQRNDIYFQKATIAGTSPNFTVTYAPARCIGTGCMNSCFPIQDVTV